MNKHEVNEKHRGKEIATIQTILYKKPTSNEKRCKNNLTKTKATTKQMEPLPSAIILYSLDASIRQND